MIPKHLLPPKWKMIWLCWKSREARKAWRIRRAVDRAAVALWNSGTDPDLGAELIALSERLWREALGIEAKNANADQRKEKL